MTAKTTRKPAKTKRRKRLPTTARGTWQHVTFRVRHTPDYLIKGTDHIELIVIAPRKEPLPITETGYLSHFVTDGGVRDGKTALAFFLDWIMSEEKSKRWQKADNKRRQGDLFAGL